MNLPTHPPLRPITIPFRMGWAWEPCDFGYVGTYHNKEDPVILCLHDGFTYHITMAHRHFTSSRFSAQIVEDFMVLVEWDAQ